MTAGCHLQVERQDVVDGCRAICRLAPATAMPISPWSRDLRISSSTVARVTGVAAVRAVIIAVISMDGEPAAGRCCWWRTFPDNMRRCVKASNYACSTRSPDTLGFQPIWADRELKQAQKPPTARMSMRADDSGLVQPFGSLLYHSGISRDFDQSFTRTPDG